MNCCSGRNTAEDEIIVDDEPKEEEQGVDFVFQGDHAEDAEAEQLKRYKEALLGKDWESQDYDCPPEIVVQEVRCVTKGKEDQVIPWGDGGNMTLKQGSEYKLQITFTILKGWVRSLKMKNTVITMIKPQTDTSFLGSFAPTGQPQTCDLPRSGWITAPIGMLYRGKYHCKMELTVGDSDEPVAKCDYSLEITK